MEVEPMILENVLDKDDFEPKTIKTVPYRLEWKSVLIIHFLFIVKPRSCRSKLLPECQKSNVLYKIETSEKKKSTTHFHDLWTQWIWFFYDCKP